VHQVERIGQVLVLFQVEAKISVFTVITAALCKDGIHGVMNKHRKFVNVPVYEAIIKQAVNVAK
jgi:hypothetical protein